MPETSFTSTAVTFKIPSLRSLSDACLKDENHLSKMHCDKVIRGCK